MNKSAKKGAWLERIISFLFLLLSVWFFIARVLFLSENVPGGMIVKVAFTVAVLAAFVVIAFFWTPVKKLALKAADLVRGISVFKMALIIITVSLLTKVILLFTLQIDSSKQEDIKMYWSFIQQLTNDGKIIENADYALAYRYTVNFALFFVPFTKVFGAENILFCNLYLVFLHTVGAYLLFDTIKYHFGKNYAFASVMAWVLLPVGMLQPLYMCHENALIIAHIIAIWLFFRVMPACKNNVLKSCCFCAVALVLVLGSLINRLCLVSIIAFIIILLLRTIKEFKWNHLVSVIAAVMVFSIVFLSASTVFKKIDKAIVAPSTSYSQSSKKIVPFGWTLYLGANYENNGTWNYDDYETYYHFKDIKDIEEARNYQKELIVERYSDYLHHPARFVKHLNDKMMVMSKTFSPLTVNLGGKVTEFIAEGMHGLVNVALHTAFAMINIVIAFVLMMSNRIGSRKNTHELNLYLKMFMMGVCALLLVTEVASKYANILLFVYLIIAVLQMRDFGINMDFLHTKLHRKR